MRAGPISMIGASGARVSGGFIVSVEAFAFTARVVSPRGIESARGGRGIRSVSRPTGRLGTRVVSTRVGSVSRRPATVSRFTGTCARLDAGKTAPAHAPRPTMRRVRRTRPGVTQLVPSRTRRTCRRARQSVRAEPFRDRLPYMPCRRCRDAPRDSRRRTP